MFILIFVGHEDRMFSKKYPGDMKWLAGLDPAEMDSWVFAGVHVSEKGYLTLCPVTRKPVIRVSDHVQHKPGCSTTEDG